MASSDDNNNRNRDKHLFYLNELSDYKVSSDDPDVRGWKVKDVDNRVIGKVDNLLVNKNTERVVYLDVEVDKSIIEANHDPYRSSASEGIHEFMNKDGEEHLIIPIGFVKLNDDDEFVYTDRVNHRTFAETKRIKKGANVNREYETIVLESYNRDTNASGDRNKTSRDNQAVTSERNRDKEKEIELPKNTDTKKMERQGTDRADSDVSHTRSTSPKDSRSNKVKDEFDPTNSKKTSFSSDSKRDSNPGNSGSEKGVTSKKDREIDEEDFYNKKEFDDSNYRKRR